MGWLLLAAMPTLVVSLALSHQVLLFVVERPALGQVQGTVLNRQRCKLVSSPDPDSHMPRSCHSWAGCAVAQGATPLSVVVLCGSSLLRLHRTSASGQWVLVGPAVKPCVQTFVSALMCIARLDDSLAHVGTVCHGPGCKLCSRCCECLHNAQGAFEGE